MPEIKVVVPLSVEEAQALRTIAELECREPYSVLRWLLRGEAKRRGWLIDGNSKPKSHTVDGAQDDAQITIEETQGGCDGQN